MPDPILSVREAQQRILSFFSPLEITEVPLEKAAGRVLGQVIKADFDLPPFPNSAMDGFVVQAKAVSNAQASEPVLLEVVADLPAGKMFDLDIQAGQAARIMTGAPIPSGADAVVPVEETDFNFRNPGVSAPSQVKVFRAIKAGENIRPKGMDVQREEQVMHPGWHIRPQDVGFLAMLGKRDVLVYRSPLVAVFSTGDELLPVEMPLIPGKIHDSNRHMMIALIQKNGGEAIDLGIVPDKAPAIWACMELAVGERVDLITTTAGVSVGAFDYVRSVIEQHGKLDFWKVNMRPGKPLAFGEYKGIPFVGLPGNPVSAFVGFEVFVRPALMKMEGLINISRPVQNVQLLEPIESDGRESYLRAVVEEQEGNLLARLTGHQGSGNLRSLVQANALLLIPSGVKFLPALAEIQAWILD